MKARIFNFSLLILLVTGCAVTPPVTFNNLPPSKLSITNNLSKVDYPSYMAGAGNIYSCRFGIYYKTPDEFSPAREIIFASLLEKNIPQIKNHTIVLLQFDVYYNKRLKQLHAAGSAIGGIIGDAAENAASRGYFGFMNKNFLIDTIPGSFPLKTGEVSVGCDNENEGEYYPSRVSGGHDVVVSWFKFSVDGKIYHFRTEYQFQPENEAQIQAGISKAIDISLENIAAQIKI